MFQERKEADMGVSMIKHLEVEISEGVWDEKLGKYLPGKAKTYRLLGEDTVEGTGGGPSYPYWLVIDPDTKEIKRIYNQLPLEKGGNRMVFIGEWKDES